ncbi:MAG: hypothetical protein K6G26_06160 [Lachnospiraceae bacterium]|nr:hypothetical protein [Lachnospiraceae bacterium]
MSSMKRKLLFVFTCVLLVIVCAGNAFAEKKSSVDMKVNVEKGIDDKCRYGRYTPVRFNLSGTTKDVQGKIIMYFPSEYSLEKNYMVEKGGETTVSFPVKLEEYNDINYVEYDILDEKGKLIKTDKVSLTTNYKEKICVGILSDEFASLAYIDNKTIDERINGNQSYGETALCEITKLDAKYISQDPQDIDYFDIIVINNYNIETLSEEQIKTIEGWVNAGGMLLIGTGENSDKSYSKFSFADNFKLENLAPAELQGNHTNATVNSYKINSKEVTVNTILGVDDAGAHMAFGQGTVAVVGFDLGVQDVSKFFDDNSENFSIMLMRLMGNLSISSMAYGYDRSYGSGDYSYIWNSLVQTEIDVDLPNPVVYGIVFFVYVILLVVVFAVLKSRNKSNYTFISLIGLSFAFCGIIYLLGMKTRITKPMVNYIDVVTLDGKNYSSTMYLGCEAPNNKKYNVSVNPKYNFDGVGNIDYWGYYYDSSYMKSLKNVKYSISDTTEGTLIKNVKVSPFQSYSYVFSGSGTVDTDVSEGINVSYFDGTYEGTITNVSDYTYEDAMIVYDNSFYYLGDIKPGDVVDLGKLDPFGKKALNYYYNYNNQSLIKKTNTSEKKFRDYCLKSYISDIGYGYSGENKVQLLYFSDSDDKIVNENYNVLGSRLFMVDKETINERNGRVYYHSLEKEIEESANYDIYEDNCIEFYNGVVEPVRVVYYLDNVDTILFKKQDTNGYYGYNTFNGSTAILDESGNEHPVKKYREKLSLSDFEECVREDIDGRKYMIVQYTYGGVVDDYMEVLLPTVSGEGAVSND